MQDSSSENSPEPDPPSMNAICSPSHDQDCEHSPELRNAGGTSTIMESANSSSMLQSSGLCAASSISSFSDQQLPGNSTTDGIVRATIPPRLPKRVFLSDELDDDDGIPDSVNPLPTYQPSSTSASVRDRIHVAGPPSLQQKINAFLERPEILQRFATTTSKFPAKLDPMKFEVDRKQWEDARKNRQPARRLSIERENALKVFLDTALADGVI